MVGQLKLSLGAAKECAGQQKVHAVLLQTDGEANQVQALYQSAKAAFSANDPRRQKMKDAQISGKQANLKFFQNVSNYFLRFLNYFFQAPTMLFCVSQIFFCVF